MQNVPCEFVHEYKLVTNNDIRAVEKVANRKTYNIDVELSIQCNKYTNIVKVRFKSKRNIPKVQWLILFKYLFDTSLESPENTKINDCLPY